MTVISRRVAALTGLAVLAVGLHAASAVLPAPPVHPSQILPWWSAADPIEAIAGVVRISALAACYWLITITALDAMASLLRMHLLARVTTALCPALWRTLVLRPVAVTALAGPQILVPLGTAAPAVAHTVETADSSSSLEMRRLDTAETTITTSSVVTAPDEQITGVDGDEEVRTITMRLHQSIEPSNEPSGGGPVEETGAPRPGSGATHVVKPGENLWSIAAAHLAEVRGERPAPREVTPYWQSLIDTNRSTLPDPDNPDLLYRGIELQLPPVP